MQASIDWHRPQQDNTIPPAALAWLLDKGSLTAKLSEHCQERFSVQRLHQTFETPSLSEQKALAMHNREIALVREVLLHCDDTPWVFARTVIPARSLHGRLAYLKKLNNDALGSFIFKYPNLQRSRFETSQIALPHSAIPCDAKQSIYARRSIFSLYHSAILVSEFFLPPCAFYAQLS